jgi:HSP20 family protein
MVETSTKLPVRTEKKPTPAPAEPCTPFETLWPREPDGEMSPAVDFSEKEKEFEITTELPGMSEKDIEVKVTNGNLVIEGEKKEAKEERAKEYYLSERRYGSFMRSFVIPPGVEVGKIEATSANGVLTVKLPKSAEVMKGETKIVVKAA